MATAIVAELTPAHRRAWLAELCMLPYLDAVASIRAVRMSSTAGPRQSDGPHRPRAELRGGAT